MELVKLMETNASGMICETGRNYNIQKDYIRNEIIRPSNRFPIPSKWSRFEDAEVCSIFRAKAGK